jgi:hypothetical protein
MSSPPAAAVSPTAAASCTPHCTICCAPPSPSEHTILPLCTHAFCLPCILSWALASPHRLCPNCKAPFQTVLTLHSPDATLHETPTEAAVDVLLATPALRELLVEPVAADEALEAAMYIPRPAAPDLRRELARAGAESGVAVYACEEVEDELEARFWAERDREDARYAAVFDDVVRGGRRGVRVVGNRRNGPGGFVSSGRLVARVAPGGAGPSGSRGEGADGNGGAKAVKVPSGGGGQRKKKVKKNSRQGAAEAAAAAARKAAAEASEAEEAAETAAGDGDVVEWDAAVAVAVALERVAVGGGDD